jgi:transmembrane sensor
MNSMASIEEERRAMAGDWLLRLQADELDQQELAAWLEWYGAEAANSAAFETLQMEYESLRSAPQARRRELANRLIETARKPGRLAVWNTRRIAIAAGVAAVMLGAGVLSWRLQMPSGDRSAHTAAYQTPRAKHENISLPDGSVVKLGALSSISLNFTDETRYLVLEGGEAFFEAARDASRPFIVQVGAVTVRAVGTAFNVRRAQERVVVAVSEGAVDVGQKKAKRGDISVRVTAGEQVSVNLALASLSVTSADPQAATAWQKGRLEFVNEPLSSVIATVNRYSMREIVVTDHELGAASYTGTVNEGRIEEWLVALQDVFPVRVTRVGGETVLLSVQK